MSETESPARTLESYALKGMHLAKMTGVSVGTHAIPDAFLLMHSGVGCKYKTAAQVGNHDWGSHPNRREAWTQVAELQLVKGSSERIGPFARAWYERRRPAFMLVVSAYFIELTGEDFSYAVDDAEKTVPCDMALIATAAPNKGFFEGYCDVMLSVMKQMDFKAPATTTGTAAAYGFFFHRYEPDQQGDLSQLKLLCKPANLDLGPVMLSGRPYDELRQARDAEYALLLPYAKPRERKIKRMLKKREIIELDLPIGIAGTTRFVRTLVAATGADSRRAEAWLEAQSKAIQDQMNKVKDHFRNLEVAVFAETPLAAGLVSLLDELGVLARFVGLRDQDGALGGRTTFFETLENNGVRDFDRMEVVQTPSLRHTRQRCTELIRTGELSGIIGSSHELNVFTQQPRTWAMTTNTFLVETGFPSDNHHVAFAAPTLGFTGAASWAQRILDAVRTPRLGAESRWH